MFSTIIWAADGSEHSNRAMDLAAEIAAQNGAHLHAVHVVERMIGARMGSQNARFDEPEVIDLISDRMHRVSEQYGIQTDVHVLTATSGHIADHIAGMAEQLGADLIVLGAHGRSTLSGLVLGSVTQQLLHIAPCPVLAIPPARVAEAGVADAGTQTAAP